MFLTACTDIGWMLLSAILNAGGPSALTMFVVAGAVPALAIVTVCVIERNVIDTRGASNLNLLKAFVQKPNR